MYYAQKEIFNQFEAIEKTTKYVYGEKTKLINTFNGKSKIIFVGSGSSFSVAKSAAAMFNLRGEVAALAVAAGDMLVNFERYKKALSDSIIVTISRSGSTSELLLAAEKAKDNTNCKCVSICTVQNSKIELLSDFSLVIPWGFDQSVCQTRTVSNLYAACSMLIAIIIDDENLVREWVSAADPAPNFEERYKQILANIGQGSWENAVVLADCEIAGLAEEGALAFKEICRNASNHYHVLDVRHGPMVMIDENTLVILAVPQNNQLFSDLVKDIKRKGAYCLTMGMFNDSLGADQHIELPENKNWVVTAQYMIFSIQVITLYKALAKGLNPDEPEGLDAWIAL